MSRYASDLEKLRSAVEERPQLFSPEELRHLASSLLHLAQLFVEEAQEKSNRWTAGWLPPSEEELAELEALRQVANDMNKTGTRWLDWVHVQESADIADVLDFTATAIGSGVIGSAAFEAAKSALARLARRPPSVNNAPSERPQVCSAARGAIIERFAEQFEDGADTLASEPLAEEVHSDGRWALEFASQAGVEFFVILGPKKSLH